MRQSVGNAAASDMRVFGKIDILVNNAGITGGNAPLWELAPDVRREVINVNLVGPYLTCRALAPHMMAAGYGRIVNIASIAGKDGQSQRLALFGVESGLDRADQIPG